MRVLMAMAALCVLGIAGGCTPPTQSALAAGETGRILMAPLGPGARVTVAEVGMPGTGWVVVHPVSGGEPDLSAPLGHAYVKGGPTSNVVVPLSQGLQLGDTVAVMLHLDTGNAQVFEFANGGNEAVDQPLLVDGAPVVEVVTAN